MSFPKGFLWGGDISANQCEGGWDEGGKSPNMTYGNLYYARWNLW